MADNVHIFSLEGRQKWTSDSRNIALVLRLDIRNSKTDDLIDLMNDFGFSVQNRSSEYTCISHNGKSVIDLFFSNFRIEKVGVEDKPDLLHLRKHLPVVIEFFGDRTERKR